MNFNRPQMGNYYNSMGMMGGPINLNTPPPTMLRQHSNDGPPGLSSSRTNMEGPPGTEIDLYRSDRRDRDRDRGDRDRRRESDGS